VSKETPQQFGMASQAPSLTAYADLDVLGGVRGEVREPAVLQVAPEEFDGIELGRVRRQPDGVAAGVGRQPRANGGVSVSPPAIPEDDEGAAHVAREMAKEAQDLRTSNVAVRIQGQRQGEPVAPRRDDQGANSGDLLMRARTHRHRRRRAAPRPGAAEHGHHQESCFIEADQVGAEPPEFFLPRPNHVGPIRGPADRRAPWAAAGGVAD